MRQLLTAVFIIMSILSIWAQDTTLQDKKDIVEKQQTAISQPQTVAEQAQYEYQEKNYRKVIEILNAETKSLKSKGIVSAELYYNLGNAYFRVNEYPEAILNYERALLYAPGDKDTRHNIDYTQTKIEDKILTADNFFLKIWFDNLTNLYPSDTWAKISIVFFIFFIVCLFLFLFSSRLNLKKTGFYAGFIFFACLIFSNIFSFTQKRKIERQDTAIVMAGSATIVSAPSGTSKDLFILHAGSKVEILKIDGNWYEIEIANGNVGWIQKEKVEII